MPTNLRKRSTLPTKPSQRNWKTIKLVRILEGKEPYLSNTSQLKIKITTMDHPLTFNQCHSTHRTILKDIRNQSINYHLCREGLWMETNTHEKINQSWIHWSIFMQNHQNQRQKIVHRDHWLSKTKKLKIFSSFWQCCLLLGIQWKNMVWKCWWRGIQRLRKWIRVRIENYCADRSQKGHHEMDCWWNNQSINRVLDAERQTQEVCAIRWFLQP